MAGGTSAVAWLVIMWLAWAGLLFGGLVLGRSRPDEKRRMPIWTRIGSSIALAFAAWGWFVAIRHEPANGYALFIALGMSLGLLGDLFMASLLPVSQPTLGGIGAFALGHVAYCAAFLRLSAQASLTAPLPRFLSWSLWLFIGLTGWYFAAYRGERPGLLHWAALPYSLLLASTAGLATGIALQTSTFITAALGGALFLLSDLLIAGRLFKKLHWRYLDDVIWLTYGPAQMFIVYSVWGAARLIS